MATENIQYVYDHTLFYSRALQPVIKDFFFVYKKINKQRQQQKFNKNSQENAVKALKPFFAPSKYVWLSLPLNAKFFVWVLISENRQQVDQKGKRAKLINIFVFFSGKHLFSNSWKILAAKWHSYLGSCLRGTGWDRKFFRIYFISKKRTLNIDKNQNLFFFLFEKKPMSQQVNSWRNPLRN